MFCQACGQSIEPEDRFCRHCGARIAKPHDTEVVPEPSPSSPQPGVRAVPRVTRTSLSTAQMHMPLGEAAPLLGSQQSAGSTSTLQPTAPQEGPVLVRRVPSAANPAPLREDTATPPAEPALIREVVPELPPESKETAARALGTETPEAISQLQACPTCGRANPEENEFCEYCGQALHQMPAAPPIEQPPPTPVSADTPVFPFSYGGDLPYTKPQPAPRRPNSSVLLIVLAVILIAGAIISVWMLHSSLPAKSATAPPAVEIAVSPVTAHVTVGKGFDFAARVSGTDNHEVTWSVQEGDAGGRVVSRGARPSEGKDLEFAVYIAPNTPGTYHLVVTSNADPSQSATAEISVRRR